MKTSNTYFICNKIKFLVNMNPHTKTDICKKLGISRQSLLNYMTNRAPGCDVLIKMKNYFNVSYAFFFEEDEQSEMINSLSSMFRKTPLRTPEIVYCFTKAMEIASNTEDGHIHYGQKRG